AGLDRERAYSSRISLSEGSSRYRTWSLCGLAPITNLGRPLCNRRKCYCRGLEQFVDIHWSRDLIQRHRHSLRLQSLWIRSLCIFEHFCPLVSAICLGHLCAVPMQLAQAAAGSSSLRGADNR